MWKKQKDKLKEMVDNGKVLKTKHNREFFLPQVKRALHLWFCEMRSKPHSPTIPPTAPCRKGDIVSTIVFMSFYCV